MRRVLLVAALGALAAPALASSQAVQTLLLNGSAPVWQWQPAQTNALPADGSVTYTGAALGGLVLDASGALTYKPNNLLAYSNTFSSWSKTGLTVTSGQADPFGGTTAWKLVEDTGQTGKYLSKVIDGVTGGINDAVYFDLTDGSTQNLAGTATNLTSISLGGGWWRISIKSKSAVHSIYAKNAGWNSILLQRLDANINIYPAQSKGSLGTGDGSSGVYVVNAGVSAVTYETTPRSQDAVVTISAAYYGPPCDYGTGCRKWAARTNLFLNSSAPATQNITTTAQSYTVSCYGSGSLTLSGTATGTATCGGTYPTPGSVTVTATAGTLTVTKSGSPTYSQVEAGAFPSPPIPTGASAVASAADSYALAGAGAAAVAAGPWAYQWIDGQTGVTSCITGAAGAFSWPSNGTIKSIKAFRPGAVPRC